MLLAMLYHSLFLPLFPVGGLNEEDCHIFREMEKQLGVRIDRGPLPSRGKRLVPWR
jgi:hypothetical protein